MSSLSDLHLPALEHLVKRSMLEQVSRKTNDLCQRTGIFSGGALSPRKLSASRFELLAGLVFPDADLAQLTLCNDFLTYLFVIDDQSEEDPRFSDDLGALAAYFGRQLAILRAGREAQPEDSAGALLADVRARLVQRASQAWLQRFADEVEHYLLRGVLPAEQDRANANVPQLARYAEQRAADSAVMCCLTLVEVAGGGELTPSQLEHEAVRELRRRCTSVVAFANDLVSYEKEAQLFTHPTNLVHVLMVHERRTLPAAFARVIEIINQELGEFELLATELAASGPLTGPLARSVRAMRACMTGNLLWSLSSSRYKTRDSFFPELRFGSELAELAGSPSV